MRHRLQLPGCRHCFPLAGVAGKMPLRCYTGRGRQYADTDSYWLHVASLSRLPLLGLLDDVKAAFVLTVSAAFG
eukprot:6619352-Alexandrium_andersonii.AAC.1